MPTKGRARSHEAIRVAPAGPVPTVTPTPIAGDGDPSGAWDDDTPDDGVEADSGVDDSTSLARQAYRGEHGTRVQIPNATALRSLAREQSGEPVEIDADTWVTDDTDPVGIVHVTGPATVVHRGGLRYDVDGENLQCSLHPNDACEHQRNATEAIHAVMEGRRLRSALTDWERNTRGVADDLAEAHERSDAAHTASASGVPDGPSWFDNPDAFQAAYRSARARSAAGEQAIPYLTENATGGLGARDGGRGFGVELEFDLPADVDRRSALGAIGRDLHAAGLLASPRQAGYHSTNDYSRWRFEADCTCAGEVVSPVLYDEPQSWRQLSEVCDIIRRHGGRATRRTGGHVHVGVGDFDHGVENHNNLLGLFAEHEDVLYRLAQRPGARAHRGHYWCRPNAVPAQGYTSVAQVRTYNPHGSGLNFGAVGGHRTDHVEFRMWDGSLDPGVIQSQVNLSLGLTDAAFRAEPGTIWGHEPVGLHRQRNGGLPRGQRLTGERWREDTASFRRLVDRLFVRQANREQATALFATTRWQRRG